MECSRDPDLTCSARNKWYPNSGPGINDSIQNLYILLDSGTTQAIGL